jgi:hypothetical protein
MNWNQLNPLIEELKKRDRLDGETFLNDLSNHVKVAIKLYNKGWPEAEVVVGETVGLVGIPIQLAYIVADVFQFCADHDIDLALWMKEATPVDLAIPA